MRRLVIDRFEGKFAVCEDGEGKYFAIELQELPAGAKEGCVMDISDEGLLSLNAEETQRRRAAVLEKQKKGMG